MEAIKLVDNQVIIVLDNGNKIMLTETDSGVVLVENITRDAKGNQDLGIAIYPVGRSCIEIVPEG